MHSAAEHTPNTVGLRHRAAAVVRRVAAVVRRAAAVGGSGRSGAEATAVERKRPQKSGSAATVERKRPQWSGAAAQHRTSAPAVSELSLLMPHTPIGAKVQDIHEGIELVIVNYNT